MTAFPPSARPFDASWIGIAFTPADGGWDAAREYLGELGGRLSLAAAGGVPVSLIAGSAFGLDLRLLALLVLAPVLAGVLFRMLVHPASRTLVGFAICAGVVATALYDLCRGSFLWLGLMDGDPIPHIGGALGIDPAWLAGYTWRYLGNGTGLALTFLALGLRGTRVGIVYGLGVCSCLLLTLVVSPYGTEILFPLNLTTVIMATLGHAIYGGVLGTIAARRHARRAQVDLAGVGTLMLSGRRQLVLDVGALGYERGDVLRKRGL
jgi:hypothetical protein